MVVLEFAGPSTTVSATWCTAAPARSTQRGGGSAATASTAAAMVLKGLSAGPLAPPSLPLPKSTYTAEHVAAAAVEPTAEEEDEEAEEEGSGSGGIRADQLLPAGVRQPSLSV